MGCGAVAKRKGKEILVVIERRISTGRDYVIEHIMR